MFRRCVLVSLLAFGLIPRASLCQEPGLPQTRNAALRYWMAFAMMQDPPVDKETERILADVTNGSAAWNEQRLGPIIDKNIEAIRTMQRATRLPECNWGLEYELGPETPLYHLARGRVLGRLNAAYGMRLASQGKGAEAAESWLAGLRFAQHLAQDSSLIGVLTGDAVLLSNLRTMLWAVENMKVDRATIAKLQTGVSTVPDFGPDWSGAIGFERLAGEIIHRRFAESREPGKLYAAWFGEQPPADFQAPTTDDWTRYATLMEHVSAAFRISPPAAEERLAEIQRETANLNKVYQLMTPNWMRVNDARQETGVARQTLLNLMVRRLNR